MKYKQIPSPVLGTDAFIKDKVTVIRAREDGRWHLSIAHPHRYPTWDEVVEARYELLADDLQVAMMLPPRSEYVNIHKNCFHLWELKE